MPFWVLPLISAGLGAAKGIYDANQKDPNSGTWSEMDRLASRYDKEADRDVGGAAVANIRNQSANAINKALMNRAASGFGNSTQNAEQLASIAASTSAAENDAISRALNRRIDLQDRSSQLHQQAAQGRASHRQQRKSKALGSILGGLSMGLTGLAGVGGSGMNFTPDASLYDPVEGMNYDFGFDLEQYAKPQYNKYYGRG